jgi:hypothetical protein
MRLDATMSHGDVAVVVGDQARPMTLPVNELSGHAKAPSGFTLVESSFAR